MSKTVPLASGNFLIPNGTFIAEVIAFLIILAVLWRWVVPPVQRSMSQRQDLIRKQFEDVRAARERLEWAEAEYKTAAREARAELNRTRQEAERLRREVIDAAKEEARGQAEEVTRRAEERLEFERRRVLAELRQEVGQIAIDLAARVLGEQLENEATQRRVVDRFLAELEMDASAPPEPSPETSPEAS